MEHADQWQCVLNSEDPFSCHQNVANFALNALNYGVVMFL